MLEREMASFVQGKLLVAGHLGGRTRVGGGHICRPHALRLGGKNRNEKKDAEK